MLWIRTWDCPKCSYWFFLNGPTPASFCLFSFFSRTILLKKLRLQQDSNLDRRRRQARWPLDHHHGPMLICYYQIRQICFSQHYCASRQMVIMEYPRNKGHEIEPHKSMSYECSIMDLIKNLLTVFYVRLGKSIYWNALLTADA